MPDPDPPDPSVAELPEPGFIADWIYYDELSGEPYIPTADSMSIEYEQYVMLQQEYSELQDENRQLMKEISMLKKKLAYVSGTLLLACLGLFSSFAYKYTCSEGWRKIVFFVHCFIFIVFFDHVLKFLKQRS